MSRSKYWRVVRAALAVAALAVVGLLGASCEDTKPRGARASPTAPPSADRQSTVRPEPPSSSAAVGPAEEGAESAEAVFARAQTLLDERNFQGLVRTIRPDTRRRWTADLVVAMALESIDEGVDTDIGRREARARARRLLETFGARASLDEHAEVNVSVLERRLLEHVRDPDGLLAAMLAFADARSCGLDPLCALGPSGIDGVVRPEESRAARPGATPPSVDPIGDAGPHGARAALQPAPPVSVAAGAVVRLFNRVRSPHKLHDVSFDGDSGTGITDAPEFLPIRFYKSNGITWLDES